MSDFRRRLMMLRKSEGGLPSGYTKLSYLEKDSNTQYINTGIIPQPEWTYEFDFERIGRFSYLCGSDLSWNSGAFNISIDLSTNPNQYNAGLRCVNFGTIFASRIIPQINERMIITKTPNQFIIGSNIFNIEIGTVKAEYPLVIFTTNRNGQPQVAEAFIQQYRNGQPQVAEAFIQQYRLYRFTIKKSNDELIMNLLPCLDKNGKPCMYDNVSKKPFYNEGTGEFLYG